MHFPNSLSELDAVYDRIAEELRTQYSLGYVSWNGRRDGKWRRIVVRVPGRDGPADPPQARVLSPPRSDATRSPPTDPSDPDHAFVSGIIRTAQRVARRLRLV